MSHFSKTFQGEAISYVQSIYAIGLVDAIKRLCLYTTIGMVSTLPLHSFTSSSIQ